MIPLLAFAVVDALVPAHRSTTALIRKLARSPEGRVVLSSAVVGILAHLCERQAAFVAVPVLSPTTGAGV